ncbi:MAG: Cof-type HAD-IIB family hydrolase [Thermoleophilia bacterium]|nr:Cof-type HAD-IIB family hydrolase [Thermoleophilia bacterium]
MDENTVPSAEREEGKRQEPQLRPVTPQTIADQVAKQLRTLIASGEYKPGDRIPAERELAAGLGVGRPAIREALRELKAQGLLVTGRGAQGTTVASLPTPSFAASLSSLVGKGAERIIELMEVRSAVEIEAAGLAARRATLEDLHRLSILATDPDEVLTPEDDVAFHAAIAKATHNPLFERIIQEPVALLHDHMAAIFEAYYKEPGGAVSLHQQHDAIRRAIRSGDEERARQSMRRHLDHVARGLAQLVGAARVIRLVFVTLDGTLLSGPRHISERVQRTVATVREAGVEVVLVSARPPRDIRPFHQQLRLMTPVIACGGALLWNEKARAGLAHAPVPMELAVEVVAMGRRLGAIANVESDDDWFTDRLSNLEVDGVVDYQVSDPNGVGTVDEVLRAGEPIDKVFLDLRDLEPSEATSAMAAIKQAFEQRLTIYEFTPGVIDILSPEASKVSMAQQLARRMQVPAEQIMAIGSYDNDATLLRWAGIGVAMGNATPAAKAAADVITSSNLRDGVAEALEQYLLGRRSGQPGLRVPKPGLVAD